MPKIKDNAYFFLKKKVGKKGRTRERKLTAQQLRNLQIVEDRLELLDIIRDLIDLELDRRGIPSEVIDHPGKLPPRRRGGKPSEAKSSAGSSFWQRIVNIVRMSDGTTRKVVRRK